jgi:hypothetical protein
VSGFTPSDAVGVASSLVLLVTLSGQVYKQWREHVVDGVSRWFFLGECGASVGFIAFSLMIHSWVFIVTNVFTLAAALAGQWVMRHNRRTRVRRKP